MSADTKNGYGIGTEEDFLRRWSRRKITAKHPYAEGQTDTTPLSPEPPARPLPCDADMPALDKLDDDSDYSGFLSPNVSDELRDKALRKLFHSAAFNVCDGLDDYDEDFTTFEALGDILTADMRHQLEMETERLEQLAQDNPDTQEQPGNTTPTADDATTRLKDETAGAVTDDIQEAPV